MRVNVVELWPEPRVQSVNVELPADEVLSVIQYVPLPRGADLFALDNTLYRMPALSPQVASALVFRLHPSDASRFLEDSILQESLVRRFEAQPLWMLSADMGRGVHTLVRLPGAGTMAEARAPRIEALRQAEMLALAQRPGALLPRSEDFHYEGPNGDHYESFLRPGTALQSVAAADAVTFWLLPHLINRDLIILDSWTVLSLGLNAALYVSEGDRRAPLVEAIQRYDEPEEEIRRRCEMAAQRLAQDLRVLLIVSVSSSGRLASRVEQVLRPAAFIRDLVTVALFSAGTTAGHVGTSGPLSLLGDSLRRYAKGDCALCHAGSTAVRIDPNTYSVALSGHDKRTRLRQSDAAQAREFFERYRNCGCVSIHRDQHDGLRHHMIHINVDMLLKHEVFRGRLDERIREVDAATDLILSPEHDAAMALADRVAEQLRVRAIACEPAKLAEIGPSDRSMISGARQILVVDDVVITGQRIFAFKNSLARARLLGQDTQISGFVGVARPQNETALQGIRDTLRSLRWVDKVILPDWHQSECPWCRELSWLGRVAPQLGESPSVRSRYTLLRNTSRGLTANLFLTASGAGSSDLTRNPQVPIFGDLQGAELFAAVASTLQYLRSERKLDESVAPPMVRVLDPADVLEPAPLEPGLTVAGRFYDPIVKASILRGVRQIDIRTPSTERELQGIVEVLLSAPSYDQLRAEVAFAILEGKLPVVQSVGGSDPPSLPGGDGVTAFLKLALRSM